MARIRTIKPEFWEDEVMGALSRDARLLYIATWNLADDAGRLRWSPEYIKAQVFPYDADMRGRKLAGVMSELERAGVVVAYSGGAVPQALAYLPNFAKHQRINRPQPPKFPPPPDSLTHSVNDSVNGATKGSVNRSSPEGKGREGIGVEGNSSSSPVSDASGPPEPVDDDDDGKSILWEACAILARRDLERRVAEQGPVGHVDAWLAAATTRRLREHSGTLLERWTDPAALAVFLDARTALCPAPVVRPPYVRAEEREKRRREGTACPSCDDSGVVETDAGYVHCSCVGEAAAC